MSQFKYLTTPVSSETQSSGQQVTIAYPKRNERRETTVLIEINSRDRNIVQYPNSRVSVPIV